MNSKEYDSKTKEEIREITELENQRKHLISLQKQGIVNDVGVVILEMTKKEFKLKERIVLQIHKNLISEVTVKKNGKEVTKWQTTYNGTRPRHSTYEALIERLYDLYFNEGRISCVESYSFKDIFELALEEKIRTEAPKEKTVRDIRFSYKAFITDEFGKLDIRTITPSQMKAYIQTTTQKLAPTKKRLYKFKGVLNLVFNYACDFEHNIIPKNPVPSTNAAYKKNCTFEVVKPEDKAFSVDDVERIRRYLINRIPRMHYDVYAYAMLFSSHTGVREGEIPSLRWEDVYDTYIHIHSQQNDEIRDGKKVYYYNPTTKNEKGVSHDGRKIPLTKEVSQLLHDLKILQMRLGISSEWVFCKKDGSWIYTQQYYESLNKVCKKLGLRLSNNHAFRIALNSYVLVPMGLTAPERAKILGHSVTTNLNFYTFSKSDKYLGEVTQKWDEFNEKNSQGSTLLAKGSTPVIKFSDTLRKIKEA